ncbi:MAG TPA: hypothetical protein VIC62_11450 [Nakamurella sp.]
MTALVTVLTVVVAVLTLLVAGLLRSHATILRRLEDLDGAGGPARPQSHASVPGSQPLRTVAGVPAPLPDPVVHRGRAPDLSGRTPAGESVVLRTAGGAPLTILAFLSSGCTTCQTFWREFRERSAVFPAGARLIIVTKGPESESPSAVLPLAPSGIDVVMSSQAWSDFRVPGSPYIVAVDGATGTIKGEGTGLSWQQVAKLLAQATGDASFLTGGPSIRKPSADAAREARVDAELLAAGILPGDASLYAPDRVEPGAGQRGSGAT